MGKILIGKVTREQYDAAAAAVAVKFDKWSGDKVTQAEKYLDAALEVLELDVEERSVMPAELSKGTWEANCKEIKAISEGENWIVAAMIYSNADREMMAASKELNEACVAWLDDPEKRSGIITALGKGGVDVSKWTGGNHGEDTGQG